MLLLALRLKRQRVAYNLLPRGDARQNHLHPALDPAARDFLSLKPIASCWHEYPVAIVQVQHSRTRKNRMALPTLPKESGGRKHSHAHDAGVAQLDPHFRAA